MGNPPKGKAPAQEIRSHQLKVSIEESLYTRILTAMEKGYYAGRYPNYFLAYLLWLGINKYTPDKIERFKKEIAPVSVQDLRINVEDSLYERGVAVRKGSPFIGITKGIFWSYSLWLGLEQYEKEILPKEL
jgi:hypothetical protein